MKKKCRKYPELTALKGRIREKKTSYRKLSESIGMASNTISDKINGFYAFDAPEMAKIATCLEIAPEHLADYFFPYMLSNSTKTA